MRAEGESCGRARRHRAQGLRMEWLLGRSLVLPQFNFYGSPKSFTAGESMHISPMLHWRFDVDGGGEGEPIGFVGIVKLNERVVDVARQTFEAKVTEAV